jgi:hypothetical protein
MQYAFGAGNFYVTQLQDALGNAISNPTPYPLMALQSGEVDFSGDIKELFGQNQFPVAVGRGKVKLQIKVKPARIMAAVWNAIFFGQTLAAGLIGNYTDNVGQVIPPSTIGGVTALSVGAGGTGYALGDIVQVSSGTSTVKATAIVTAVAAGVVTALQVATAGSYTVAPTAAGATAALTGVGTGLTVTATMTVSAILASPPFNAIGATAYVGTFAADLGVFYVATGLPLKRVVSAPATGQYSVNTATGLYTFSAADAGLSVYINMQYTNSLATASQQTVLNLPMGYMPTFKADLTVNYLGKLTTFSFPMCAASKMNLAFKNEDFAVPDFAFEAFDPGNGQVMKWALSE